MTISVRALLYLVIVCSATGLLQAQVHIQQEDNRISVEINGKPFTALWKGEDANKPFLYPLCTASGKPVTRAFPMEKVTGESTDHPHQRSLWIGAEHVSGIDFWENEPSYQRPNKGTIKFRKVLAAHDGKDQGDLTILAQWLSPNGEALIDETLKLTFYAKPEQNRMFDVDLQLKARKKLVFEDDHDAILGLRLGTPFEEKSGGKVVNAEGIEGADHIRGTHSAWADWQANLEGEQVGVAIMDSPRNFRFPTPWHVRPYGMLFASPFAQHDFSPALPDGSLTLQSGNELHLRYRILIHPANVPVASVFEQFATK